MLKQQKSSVNESGEGSCQKEVKTEKASNEVKIGRSKITTKHMAVDSEDSPAQNQEGGMIATYEIIKQIHDGTF